jgi:hypothetical protein
MTLKVLAIVLSLIAMTSSLTTLLGPSDAYKLGYAEGKFDGVTEFRAMQKFYACAAQKQQEPQACWDTQIDSTKVVYRSWDNMTDQQKLDFIKNAGGTKWADILRGKGDHTQMPPPNLPVEIKK